jgi:molecular chaperone GrpE
MTDKNHQKEHKNNGPKNDAPKETPDQLKPIAEQVVLSKEEFAALKAKADGCDAAQDKYVRAHAEFENIRKRLEKEKSDFARYANESLIFEFLPIVDNLEMAEKYIKEAKDFAAVREGVDMIQSQIQKFLKDLGVEKIKTIGEKFDPHLHDPMETDEAKDKDEGLIVGELKPGYRLNGRLLRPASVRIVKHKDIKEEGKV